MKLLFLLMHYHYILLTSISYNTLMHYINKSNYLIMLVLYFISILYQYKYLININYIQHISIYILVCNHIHYML